ncbi:tubby-like protein [Phytophthora infestans T30-4]|uniref:Tubby-like protein n=1 Tax=Phytophthora infestans (strain T30-4) TaxID=403677 RepID=D0NIU6_PHYIT|nr:tubby-like protein [Phytophthora infestans T30-4]EEY59430.1 tubby-like protein [Phytophthora infestans T30-4]|eukprot:XP_002901040.1 tubby-like protein [Phytophthora infestans T30-4]
MSAPTSENAVPDVVSPSRGESADARDVLRNYERSLTAAVLSPLSAAARSPRNVAHSVAMRSINSGEARGASARHMSPRAVHHSSDAFADAPPVVLATFSPRRRALSEQKETLEAANIRVDLAEEEGKAEEEGGDGEVDTLRPHDRISDEAFASSGRGQIKGAEADDDSEGGFICMDEFSARRKAYPLPCTGQCTGAFVHYRCIMAWLGQSGSCPLCRGTCDPLVLQPMQKLELQDMTKMALQPVPLDAGIIRCYVKQVYRGMFKQYGYELYLQGQIGTQEEDKFLLAARRQVRSNMTANYTICTDKECTDAKRIGRMGSNFLGTCFTLYDNGRDPQKLAKIQDAVSSDDLVVQNVLQIREELGCVTYEPNRTSVGPRKMRVVIPDVDEEGGSSKIVRPMSRQDRLVTRLSTGEMKDLMRFSNREPVFREDLGAYCLDFGGRVSMASVKNFQLISSEDPSMGNILQFGRVADDMFTMDFQWPLSPFQAFSICLSSCDTKLACV